MFFSKFAGLLALGIFLSLLAAHPGQATPAPRWLQQPAISPNGQWIAFSYQGNIFKVPAAGGTAVQLTKEASYNGYPVWNHAGTQLAFASDRHGNFDVYVMDPAGQGLRRLTTHSARDIPYDFSPDDSRLLFGTARHDGYASVRTPQDAAFAKLYDVPAAGGRSRLLNDAGMEFAHYNAAGDQLLFQDTKGSVENNWRKHHISALTRDIWTYQPKTNLYTKVSAFKGEDREPVWGSGDAFYYLSEASGTLNLVKSSLRSPAAVQPLTSFTRNPVRNLSRAATGQFAFTYNGDIYTLREGQPLKKVVISLRNAVAEATTLRVPVKGAPSEMAVSADGQQVALVYRGDIFVTSADGKTTRQLTSTPYQEHMVQFSPDGRRLLYSVEHTDSWDIEQLTLRKPQETTFYAATQVSAAVVLATAQDEFQGRYSPDGQKIAYLENRNVLKTFNLKTRQTHTLLPAGLNFSGRDGDQYFTWSPDSQYLLAESAEGLTGSEKDVVLLRDDASGQRRNLTLSGFVDELPQWGMQGTMMYWLTNKNGLRSFTGESQRDVYGLFFSPAAWDRFRLSAADLAKQPTVVAQQAEARRQDVLGVNAAAAQFALDRPTPSYPAQRLTPAAMDLGGATLSADGEQLYYLAQLEDGYDLWATRLRTHESRLLTKLSAGQATLYPSPDGRVLFVLTGENVVRIDPATGTATPLPIEATQQVNTLAERTYIFEHRWNLLKKKLLYADQHGADWDCCRATYRQFLPHITRDYDFQVLLSELAGELNVSHTTVEYHPDFPQADATAALGLLYDLTLAGPGLLVKEVLPGGPFDVVDTHMRANVRLDKIDGVVLADSADWASLLNHKAGQPTRIAFHDLASSRAYEETVRPVSNQTETYELLYARWVRRMEHLTDSLSGGQVGYVHVRYMFESEFRQVYDKALGKYRDKAALLVDTRFNPGGSLHEQLLDFLSGQAQLTQRPQGQLTKGSLTDDKWTKPSCVVMNSANYSDGYLFPLLYQRLGLGKVIGTPVAGTGTAASGEVQLGGVLFAGLPYAGTYLPEATQPNENKQLEPDILVDNDYARLLAGEDQQLAAAIQELLRGLKP